MIGLVGDNLGQHQVLGFVESFRANYACIRCKAPRAMCQTMTKFDATFLRTPENYESDLEENNVSETGINRRCILNDIVDYHVTSCIIYDIMHDLLEGVCNVGMSGVLKQILKIPGINIDLINNRIECFDFGTHSNRPILLTMAKIEKGDLGMSASEMLNLVKYFSIIIGDLVPRENSIWEYYLVLNEILDIVMRKKISANTVSYLENLISRHHFLYIKEFGSLKPKTHNMLHYSECIKKFGPLGHNWSMRFEAMHYKAKLYAQAVRSRVNVSKSILMRHNFTVAYETISGRKIGSFYESISSPCGEEAEPYFKWIVLKGIKFEIGSFVMVEASADLPKFGFIKYIMLENCRPFFVVDIVTTVTDYPHMRCYICESDVSGFEIVDPTQCSHPVVYKPVGNLLYASSFGL